MDNKFETEVLSRLAVIESKLDDYKGIKEKSELAYSKSIENEKDIQEIKEKTQWLSRTITGTIITAILTGVIGVFFVFFQK